MFPLLSLQMFGAPVPAYVIPTFGLCLVTAAFSGRFQRLGDIVCGATVVVEERKWLTGIVRLEDPRAAQLASYIPMDFRVSRSLARAVAAYVDRRRFFAPARRREVARHLALPLLARFGFPADTSYDLLLCAVYYRAFVAERVDDEHSPFAARVASAGAGGPGTGIPAAVAVTSGPPTGGSGMEILP
jgi:hypothetical protein